MTFVQKNILLLKIILICIFIFSFWYKIKDHSWNFENLNFNTYTFLLFLLIIPVNWFIEWMKWKIITDVNELKDKKVNIQAFASGVISSFLTPALSGNFLGRIFHYENKIKLKLAVQTFIANGSQFIVSICVGLITLFHLMDESPTSLVLLIAALIIIFYLTANKILKVLNIRLLNKWAPYILESSIRIKFLFLSSLRYIVFLLQYFLILSTFGIEPSMEVLQLIVLVFLFVTISPSILFGKVLIREGIAIGVFGMYNYDINTIAVASICIWVFSIFIPSLFSILLIEKSKNHAYA